MTTSILDGIPKVEKKRFNQGDVVRYIGTINGKPHDDFVLLVTNSENVQGTFSGTVMYVGPDSVYSIGEYSNAWNSISFERYYGMLHMDCGDNE